jgi:2-polyprenyl-3-methyl-5-hydroxy-6-metoxy-1,4-benzoquinol methylase
MQSPDAELWAVEPDADMARAAETHFDRVVVAEFPIDGNVLPKRYFDIVTFTDVLEHMSDPQRSLREAAELLAPDGVVVACIPNVRHRSVLMPLLRRGEWQYEDTGLLDRTHVRFFTRSSILSMFRELGWSVDSIQGVNSKWHWNNAWEGKRVRLLRRLGAGKWDDFFFVHYVIVASPPSKYPTGH